MFQTVGDHPHTHLMLLSGIKDIRRLAQRDGIDAEWRLLGMHGVETGGQTGTRQQLQTPRQPISHSHLALPVWYADFFGPSVLHDYSRGPYCARLCGLQALGASVIACTLCVHLPA